MILFWLWLISINVPLLYLVMRWGWGRDVGWRYAVIFQMTIKPHVQALCNNTYYVTAITISVKLYCPRAKIHVCLILFRDHESLIIVAYVEFSADFCMQSCKNPKELFWHQHLNLQTFEKKCCCLPHKHPHMTIPFKHINSPKHVNSYLDSIPNSMSRI